MPFGAFSCIWEGLEEDEEADIPEGSKAGVVDGVEDCDKSPGLWSSGEDGAIVRIIEEISEGLKSCSVPSWRFDGNGSQQIFLLYFSSCVLLAHVVICLSTDQLLSLVTYNSTYLSPAAGAGRAGSRNIAGPK